MGARTARGSTRSAGLCGHNRRAGRERFFARPLCNGPCTCADGRHSLRLKRVDFRETTDMLLALDVGNTNTVLGLYRLEDEKAGELAAHWRVTTHRTQTADEYGVLFVNLFTMSGLSVDVVKHIMIS